MAILIAELVGFAVVLLVLYRFVVPLLKNTIGGRQQVIQQQVDDAEEATRKLEQAERRLDAAVAEARTESARIRDDARADATRIRDELTEQAEREVERIRLRGVEQLAAQRDQIVRHLRADLGGQSMQLAERVVVQTLAEDTARSSTVDRFLDGIDQMPARGTDSRLGVPAGGGAI